MSFLSSTDDDFDFDEAATANQETDRGHADWLAQAIAKRDISRNEDPATLVQLFYWASVHSRRPPFSMISSPSPLANRSMAHVNVSDSAVTAGGVIEAVTSSAVGGLRPYNKAGVSPVPVHGTIT
jgi:hypothetical protein